MKKSDAQWIADISTWDSNTLEFRSAELESHIVLLNQLYPDTTPVSSTSESDANREHSARIAELTTVKELINQEIITRNSKTPDWLLH